MLCWIASSITTAASEPAKLGDGLRAPVAEFIRTLGTPKSIVSTDAGHVFTWAGLRLTTDDDAIVRVVDRQSPDGAPLTVSAAGSTVTLVFGKPVPQRYETYLASIADYSGAGSFAEGGKAVFRGFRDTPETELVFLLDPDTQALKEAIYGERGFIGRIGLLLGTGMATPLPAYHAPILEHEGVVDYPRTRNSGDAVIRETLDAKGNVLSAKLIVASRDPSIDRAAIAQALGDRYRPALLGNVPVSAVVFRLMTFHYIARGS